MIKEIDWKKCGNLIPAVIQDEKTLEVLMLGFMSKEAIKLTLQTQKVHFFSRTKNRIWMKGESSGNYLQLVDIKLDCDKDSLLVLVNPIGNTCHKGSKNCFDFDVNFISKLEKIVDLRIKEKNEDSYVSRLFSKGINKIAQKVGEEGVEVVIAAINENDELLLSESADLLFHLILTLKSRNLSFFDVIDILKERSR